MEAKAARNMVTDMRFGAIRSKAGASLATLTLAAALLAGCAGREAAPVAVSQADDPDKSCHQLLQELNYNQYRMALLVRESNHIKANNADVAAGVAPFFPPVMVAYDKGEAQSIELKAFQDRNANLTKLAVDKGC
jgi:hypothetical protein